MRDFLGFCALGKMLKSFRALIKMLRVFIVVQMFQDPYSHKINLSNSMNSGQSYVSRNKKKQEIPITYYKHVSVFMRQRGKSKTTSTVANLPNTFKGLYVCVCGGGGFKGPVSYLKV